MRKYIITGGPGVGKTTILNKLAEDGHPIIREVPRTIIRYEQRFAEQQGREAILPQNNVEAFQYQVALRQLYKEQQLEERSNYGFLDRSLIDPLGYQRAFKFRIPSTFQKLINQANYHTVFFLEELDHYENDRERYENKELATTIHEALREEYQEQNIRYISIPDIGIQERVDLIYEKLMDNPLYGGLTYPQKSMYQVAGMR